MAYIGELCPASNDAWIMQNGSFTSTGIPYRCYKVCVHIPQSAQDLSLLGNKQDIPNPQELYL